MAVQKQTTTKSSAKKKAPTKAQQQAMKEASKKQICILVAFASALLFGSIVFINAGGLWGLLRSFIFGTFGLSAFLLPFFILFLSIVAAIGKDSTKYKHRVIEGVILFTLLVAFIHIVRVDETLSYGEQIKNAFFTYKNYAGTGAKFGMGVYGAVFGGIPLLLTGGNKLAGGIITILILFVLFMLFSGTTIIRLLRSLKAPAEAIGDYAEEKITDYKDTYETVSTDIHEKKARDAVKKEKETDKKRSEEEPKRSSIDIPLDAKKGKPDMGINDIFTEAKLDDSPEVETLEAHEKRTKAINLDENINKLDDFEVAPPATNVPFEELLSEKMSKTDKKLKKTVEAIKEEVPEADVTEDAEEEVQAEAPVEIPKKAYELPSIDFLDEPKNTSKTGDAAELREKAQKIVNTLQSFGVGTKIVDICRSPSVTRFELQPDPGVKISKITSLSDDIAMNLAASGVRIEAPIPNKNAVGIEVPNSEKTAVTIREIIDSPAFKNAKSKLNVVLGRDIQGEPTCTDLAKMPHLLVAGTTGSGKSVCLNAMIVSLLYNATPEEVKLIMIDPKNVEFSVYRSIPHLLVPVVSNPRKAAGALSWAVAEMDKRYALFAENGARNLQGYNNYAVMENIPKLPQIVIIIDEFSDLMMAASNEVEDSVCRLAQKARAAGMHLIVATQRPSVDVITGLIKANVPSRIALTVKSQIDSRTIIDTQGAEKLLGNGDMLFCPVGLSKPVRIQGSYVSDAEIERVVDYVKSQSDTNYDDSVMQEIELKAAQTDKKKPSVIAKTADGDDGDEMIPKAIEVVVENGMASTTLLQRKLKLGYARAARIIDELAEKGIVGPYEGSKPRKVLITKDQWYEMQALSSSSAPKQLSLEDMSPEKLPYSPPQPFAPSFDAVTKSDENDDEDNDDEPNYFGSTNNGSKYEHEV